MRFFTSFKPKGNTTQLNARLNAIRQEGEIKQLKAENNELKDKLNDATDNGKPYSGLPVSND
jgi:cell division protein FtsB